MKLDIQFPSGSVRMHFATEPFDWSVIGLVKDKILITNKHIARLYPNLFANEKTLVISAGEHTKDIGTIAYLAGELLKLEATRSTMLIGVGGGVITDITGFLASIYMRGISFGFIPTSLLGMVDASIGGKNGVNVNLNKNILGVFHHPEFIVFDTSFLKTLPNPEWSNGFAEIIKYAICFDPDFFTELSRKYLPFYKEDTGALSDVIKKCVAIKCRIVSGDENESGERKLLNFGHTVGHAIENLYGLSHGNAVAIGMQIACRISEKVCGLNPEVTEKLLKVLRQYYLPVSQPVATTKVMEILKMDKKRNGDSINFILLEATGKAVIKPLSFDIIEQAMVEYERNN